MPIGGNNAYPSMETVLNLVRSIVQDDMAGATDTVGEGQVFVDNMAVSVTMSNFFNSSLRELCRRLRLTSNPRLIRDMYILTGLPPVNSGDQGVGASNPGIQQNLGFTGFFDGLIYWPNFTLPNDCLMADEVWERATGTNGNFVSMGQPARAIPSFYQGFTWGMWEWRQDGIWIPGATVLRDMRIRYQARLQDQYQAGVDLTQTFIPIVDCEEAMAYLMAKRICVRQGAPMTQEVKAEAEQAILLLTSEATKRAQGIDYEVKSFGSESMGLN